MGLRQVSAELASGFLLLILKKAVGHPTPRPERRTGPAYAAFPSPRLRGRSRSRRPGALADRFGAAKARPSPAGRGRNVRRAAKNPARLMVHNGFDCCSLSHRERVRVRGKAGHLSGTSGIPDRSPSPAHLGTAPAGPRTVPVRRARPGTKSLTFCSPPQRADRLRTGTVRGPGSVSRCVPPSPQPYPTGRGRIL